jgi:hypothetical protein
MTSTDFATALISAQAALATAKTELAKLNELGTNEPLHGLTHGFASRFYLAAIAGLNAAMGHVSNLVKAAERLSPESFLGD